ncbi:hypothetical protein LTR16_010285, partial [Cryomyces antarcticus]
MTSPLPPQYVFNSPAIGIHNNADNRPQGPPRPHNRLAALGCSIAVHYHSASTSSDLVATLQTQYNVHSAAFQADIRDYDQVRRLHAEVVSVLGA